MNLVMLLKSNSFSRAQLLFIIQINQISTDLNNNKIKAQTESSIEKHVISVHFREKDDFSE
jgi:hypothetical protein